MGDAAPVCANCGGPMPPPNRRGRPARYCSERCRYQHRTDHRTRGGEFFPPPTAEAPAARRDALARALAEAMDDDRTVGTPEERLATCLIEAVTVADHLRRLERELPHELAARAVAVGGDLVASLSRHFGEVMA